MEVYVMAYAKLNIVKEVKDILRYSKEHQTLNDQITAAKKRYSTILEGFQREVEELKAQKLSPQEFRNRARLIDQRAGEALKPISLEIGELEKNLKEVEPRLLLQELPNHVGDEIDKVRRILSEQGVANPQEDKVLAWGKLGRSGVLNLHFDIDRDNFKQLKRKLSETTFNKIEVFVEG